MVLLFLKKLIIQDPRDIVNLSSIDKCLGRLNDEIIGLPHAGEVDAHRNNDEDNSRHGRPLT